MLSQQALAQADEPTVALVQINQQGNEISFTGTYQGTASLSSASTAEGGLDEPGSTTRTRNPPSGRASTNSAP